MLGCAIAVRPVPKFEVEVGVAAEQPQHAADGVGMVIVAVATVIDRVFSASVDPLDRMACLVPLAAWVSFATVLNFAP